MMVSSVKVTSWGTPCWVALTVKAPFPLTRGVHNTLRGSDTNAALNLVV